MPERLILPFRYTNTLNVKAIRYLLVLFSWISDTTLFVFEALLFTLNSLRIVSVLPLTTIMSSSTIRQVYLRIVASEFVFFKLKLFPELP